MDLKEILKKEERNSDHIYLYKEENGWYAYEQSAFYCYSLLGIVDVGWLLSSPRDAGSMIIRVHISNMDKLFGNPLLKLLTKSNTECVILCRNFCRGFHYWRDEQETNSSYFFIRNEPQLKNNGNDNAWLGVLFNQNCKTKEMNTAQQNETPIIDHIYDPLSQRHDGTITPCAPVLISGQDLLCWAKEQVEFCLCRVEEPGRLIPVNAVYKHTEKQMLVAMPDLEKGEYHPVFRLVNENGKRSTYYFPDTWQVKNLSLVEIYTDRRKIHPIY